MGTVHKFKRPPKNEQQFRGYQPHLRKGAGKTAGRRLRGWQTSVIAWSCLILLAVGFWVIEHFLN